MGEGIHMPDSRDAEEDIDDMIFGKEYAGPSDR